MALRQPDVFQQKDIDLVRQDYANCLMGSSLFALLL